MQAELTAARNSELPLIKPFQEEALSAVIGYASRLLVATAVMAGSFAMMGFRNQLVPGLPVVATFAGSGLMVASFVLLAWIAWNGLAAVLQNRATRLIERLLALIFFFGASVLFVIAGVYAIGRTW